MSWTTEIDSPFPGLQPLGIGGANDGRYKGGEEEIGLQLHVRVRQVTRAARVRGEWRVDGRLYIVRFALRPLPFEHVSFLCYVLIFQSPSYCDRFKFQSRSIIRFLLLLVLPCAPYHMGLYIPRATKLLKHNSYPEAWAA